MMRNREKLNTLYSHRVYTSAITLINDEKKNKSPETNKYLNICSDSPLNSQITKW